MDFAIRDIEWEGQPAVQLQGWSERDGQFAHAADICVPDRDAAITRLQSLAKRGNLEPREVPEGRWIDPNGRFVWRCGTSKALLTLTDDRKTKGTDTITVDLQAMGGRLNIALTREHAREFMEELNRFLANQ